jgi:Periplasmic protease
MDEPMDTIFIKHVRPHSPAAAAGLVPGDRVVAVNNQTIADLPYAEVVQLIQNSPAYLHLLVVPKENDLLQLVSGYTCLGASLLSDLLNSSSALGWG